MRVMSQLLVHIRPGCGHRLWCALCLKVHLLSILPLYNQSRTLQGYWDPVLTSRGVCPAQHTLVRSPRDHGRVSLLRRTEQDSVTGYGAAAPHGLVLSLRRFKQTQPSHPHTLRQKSTGSSRAWRSPFLSFVSFLRVWRLTCLNASQSAPQIYRPAHHTSGTPARPVPANKSAGSPSVPRRLKSPAPRLLPSPPHARPRMSGTLILQPVSTSWLLLPHDHDHDHDPKPHPCIFGSTGQGRGAQTVQIMRAPAWDDISIDVCWLIWEIAG